MRFNTGDRVTVTPSSDNNWAYVGVIKDCDYAIVEGALFESGRIYKCQLVKDGNAIGSCILEDDEMEMME